MKKNDVKIGQRYMVRMSKGPVPVRIDARKPGGGWEAKNLVSGRKVPIKSGGQILRKCTQADLSGLKRPTPKQRTKKATPGTTSPTGAKRARKAASGKGRDTGQTGAKTAKPTRISGLTAAHMVLVDAGTALNVKQIVEIAAEKGWWKSDAATPSATIYAAVIREIATKGKQSRFKKVGRGKFAARVSN